jgi:sigma-54 dependent transcriptional regulator, acetoin dehydrogenase operon transcriptional activator AcoR
MPDLVRDLRYELKRVGLRGAINTDGVVPDLIVRSWRRAIGGEVAGDAPAVRYQEVDTDSLLCRAAAPIFDRWQSQLAHTGTTLLLSDRSGSIVMRRASDSGVKRRLDRVHAAEGFDYSEDSVGTNGLGTSIAEKNAVYITGSQHFNDLLADLTCAAAPVSTPAGSVIGSISMSARNDQANPLMLSLTKEIGQQIEERLRSTSRPEDLALAMSFMRYTNSKRPTVVMDQESMLANTPGLPYVNVNSHVLLWELVNAHHWGTGPVADLTLNGTSLRVAARRVIEGPKPHYVLHFDDLEPSLFGGQSGVLGGSTRVVASLGLPLTDLRPSVAACGVIVVEGPVGSGRATAAMDLHVGRPPETWAATPESPADWEAREAQLAGGTSALIRDVDGLGESDVARLDQLVRRHIRARTAGGRASELLMTLCRENAPAAVLDLVDRVGVQSATEPLSATPERIPGLVKRILDRVDPHHRHTISPAALQAMVQWTWPGNIAELASVVTSLVHDVPASVIQRRHLPQPLQQALPRRQLSMLESAERDAIIRALDVAAGNKSEAADLLGIGRTTLYRRLKHFNLDGDESSL